MERMKLENEQAAHHETQETIRTGDKAEGAIVRLTRPFQSTVSLLLAGWYVMTMDSPDYAILGLLLTLPWAYAGLRQYGKHNALASLVGNLKPKKN
jgi:hypothetical protein